MILVEPLGVFLILYIPTNLFLIHPDRRNTVAAAPKVIAPISPEAHYLAAANLDYLFINSIEPWKFELNPTKNNDGLKERHCLYSPLEYQGSIMFVKTTVREYIYDWLEKKLYSIEVIDPKP